jgi:Putative Zn-dependent protease, contains TPR repeats
MDGSTRIDELEQKFIENPRRYFAPLANEYRKAGNPHQAIAICRAHLAQLPGHMSGQIVYGQALFEGGEYEEARTVFENALAMDRENLVALRHLGDLALRSGETAAAREWYRKILELDPRDATVIALVNELDAAADAQSPAGAVEESAQQPGQPEEAPTVAPVVAAEPETSHSDEEDRLISEELGYPVPPPKAFVTRRWPSCTWRRDSAIAP